MIKIRHKKGQSTLEYIVVLTAIVAGIIWAATQFVKPTIQDSMGDAQTAFGSAADKLKASIPGPTE